MQGDETPTLSTDRCPVCGYAMTGERRRPSRDRIRPGAWGGHYQPANIRIICQLCNTFRAAAGHCIGALACARAVAASSRQSEAVIMQRWKFGMLAAATNEQMRQPTAVKRDKVKRMPGSKYPGSCPLTATLAEFYELQNLAEIGSRVARDLARESRRGGVRV